MPMKSAMIDGTFDPLHGGHVGQLLRAHEVEPFSKAYVLINKNQPHKPDASSWQHRLQMGILTMAAVRRLPFDYEIVAVKDSLDFDRHTPVDYRITGIDSYINDLRNPADHAFATRWRTIILSYPDADTAGLQAAVAAAPATVRQALDYVYVDETQVPMMNYDFDSHSTMSERVHATDIRAGKYSSLIPPEVREYILENQLYNLKNN